MAPWKERLRAKLSRKNSLPSPLGEALSTSITSHTLVNPDPAALPPSSPEQLWNQAYDQVITVDSSTVDTYEKILSARLSQRDADSADLSSQQNVIEQDPDKRWKQMRQLVQDGLHRTEKDTNVKEGIASGIQAAMAVKEVVDKAVQAAPQAALAWVGVCFALEMLMNPLTQASSNRQGIVYVVSRMDWYWNLSSLLLDENMTEVHSQGLRDELEKIITQLYAKLLLYQMKSVCYYHRGRLSVFTRDLLKLENWDSELSNIQAAEASVQSDSAQYNTLSIRNRLGSIAETAKSQNTKLDAIGSAIREQTKQRERMFETRADNKCLADLCSTDPRHDKTRIEETKGGLLKDSYGWILKHPDFQRWRNDPQSRLLWVRADPGKGKTMLLCGIINELKESMAQTGLLSYFFCQATDSRINNATAVLRGLVYLLVNQQPSLISHIREKYDHTGKSLFEDMNAWVALSDIFTNILQDPNLHNTYLIIDALDECETDLPKLLDFIVRKSSASPRVKWIISSRNWPSIEKDLDAATQNVQLRLELNEKSVSAAVATYIQSKINALTRRHNYSNDTRDTLQRYLSLNANGTFLWVALVCQELFNISGWRDKDMVKAFPPGLDALYKRMLGQIRDSSDARLCKSILAVASAVYRPVTLEELGSLVDMPDGVTSNSKALSEIILLCGSFLALRERTVSFVHQSAKDFLLKEACHVIFPSGINNIHRNIFSRSLQVMSTTLQRDIYHLSVPGLSIDQVKPPNPNPLAAARYSCLFWAKHLLAMNNLKDSGSVYSFLYKSFLYWLEALSLMDSLSDGIMMIRKLENWLQADKSPDLYNFIYDARRFAVYNRSIIEQAPLQLYCSAILFAPEKSIVREIFSKYIPTWIERKPRVQAHWSAALQTLEGHSSGVTSVAFSPDGTQVVSGSRDKTARLWDTATGAALQTLEGHSNWVTSVAFSPDGTQVVSGSRDKTVRLWDTTTGAALQTLEGHSGGVTSVAFSPDGTQVVSGSRDETVRLWDATTGAALQTLEGHSGGVTSVAFLPDGMQVVSGSDDKTVRLWDAATGVALQTLEGHSGRVTSVAFSPNGIQVVSGSRDKTVRLWGAATGAALQTLEGHSSGVTSVTFSPDGQLLPTLHVFNHWLVEGNTNLLWLPIDCRPICEAVWNRLVILGHSLGRISFLQIQQGLKLITAN